MSQRGSNTAKTAFNQRIAREKRWGEYAALREQLKREGVAAAEAWKVAARMFPRLDGGVHELDGGGDGEGIAGGSGKAPSGGTEAGGATSQAPGVDELRQRADMTDDELRSFLDANFGFGDDEPGATEEPGKRIRGRPRKDGTPALPRVNGERQPSRKVEASATAKASNLPPGMPPVPKELDPKNGFVKYAKEVAAASGVGTIEQQQLAAATWAKLTADVPSDRRASPREDAEWVYQNSSTPVVEIAAADVPSRGAIGLLKWVQSSYGNYSDFLKTIWAKCIPTGKGAAGEDDIGDDGREQLKMLEAFEDDLGIRAGATAA